MRARYDLSVVLKLIIEQKLSVTSLIVLTQVSHQMGYHDHLLSNRYSNYA